MYGPRGGGNMGIAITGRFRAVCVVKLAVD